MMIMITIMIINNHDHNQDHDDHNHLLICQGLPPLPLDINTRVDPVIISHGKNTSLILF